MPTSNPLATLAHNASIVTHVLLVQSKAQVRTPLSRAIVLAYVGSGTAPLAAIDSRHGIAWLVFAHCVDSGGPILCAPYGDTFSVVLDCNHYLPSPETMMGHGQRPQAILSTFLARLKSSQHVVRVVLGQLRLEYPSVGFTIIHVLYPSLAG